MKNPKSPVLFLNTWYPNREDPWLGLFIRKHARALALYHPVISLYLKSAPVSKMECDWDASENYLALHAYYPAVTTRIPVWRGALKLFRYIWYLRKAWKELQHTSGNILPVRTVLNVAGPICILGIWLKILYGIPLFWFEHWNGYLPDDGRYAGIGMKLRAKLILFFSTRTGAVSQLLADSLQNLGLARKMMIIPNVVNPEFLEAGKNIRPPDLPCRLAHMSNFAPFKQADKILEAVTEVFKSRNDFVFEFPGLDSPAKNRLQQQAILSGLKENQVRFVPVMPEDQVAGYMQGLTGLVMYSTHETQGVVVLEAWSCGIPVICTPGMGAWAMGTEASRLTVDPNDLHSLVQAIHTLLDRHSDFDRQAIAAHASAQFNPQHLGRVWMDWLQLK